MDNFNYIELVENNIINRGTIVTLDTLPKSNFEVYRSLYTFTKDFINYTRENKGSVSGYNGTVFIDNIIIDFDGEDLSKVLIQYREFINYFISRYNVDNRRLKYYFSGAKGFHLSIPAQLFNFQPSVDLPNQIKNIVTKLTNGNNNLFDMSIYDKTRVIRYPNTINEKTKLYKIELTSIEAMSTLTINDILELAKQPRDLMMPRIKVESNPELVKLKEQGGDSLVEKHEDSQSSEQKSESSSPPVIRGKLCYAKILSGVDEGNRDNCSLRLATYFKKQGMDKDTALSTMLKWNEKNRPPLRGDEITRRVESAYNTDYDFGCGDEVLKLFCSEECILKKKREELYKPKNTTLEGRILDYLSKVNKASKSAIELSLIGNRVIGDEKIEFDSLIDSLEKEGRITKVGLWEYTLPKKMTWVDTPFEEGKRINFKMPYLDDVSYFNWGDEIIIGSQMKYGKCFAKGTKILMSDGSTKSVEKIQEGDLVQGCNNEKRRVLNTCTGFDMMYKISPIKSESFTVNSEHILCLYNGAKNIYENITVKNYVNKSNSYKNVTKLYSDKVNWTEKQTDLEPYFLGLWLGDGHSAGGRITTLDFEVIQYLTLYAKKLNFTLSKYYPKNRCPMYSIVDKTNCWQHKYDIVQRLRKYDLINNKHIPKEFLTNSEKNRLELLAGLIDSDGYLTHQNNFELSFVNRQLAQNVVFLARSLGYSAKSVKAKASFNTIRYRILISGKTGLIPTKIDRKKSDKITCVKNPLHSGFKIKKLPKQKYYGFMVDGDKKYLLGTFIVSHNTTLGINIVKQIVIQGIKPYYIFNEPGAGFEQTAKTIGLNPKDFYRTFCSNPEEIIIEPNSVVIYDWVKPLDYAKTDTLFNNINEKLYKTKALLICFVQLKAEGEQANQYFAPNLLPQFPTLICKYLHNEESHEGTYTHIEVDYMRRSKIRSQKATIATRFNWDTMIVSTVKELGEDSEISK